MWSGDQGLNDPSEVEDPQVVIKLLEEEKENQ
jgi:hypothetical protein